MTGEAISPQDPFPFAVGSIGPSVLLAEGKIDPDKARELAEDLNNGEFWVSVSDKNRPNAPGGTFSLVVADALTTGRWMGLGDAAYDHAKKLFAHLIDTVDDEEHRRVIPGACIDGRYGERKSLSVVGGHDGEHGEDDCGAQKKLSEIFDFIASQGAEIRAHLEVLGIITDDETHNQLVTKSNELLSSGYASDGLTIRKAYVETAGPDSVVRLSGNHGEIEAEANLNPALTLDREKIAGKYGDSLGAFNVDIGVFAPASAIVSTTEREAYQKERALYYYTIATSAVLGHTSLAIVPRNG